MTATADALRIWGPLGPWRDHSSWARSVVWSCGRPGYVPLFREGESEYRRAYLEEWARFGALAAQVNPPDAFIGVSGV